MGGRHVIPESGGFDPEIDALRARAETMRREAYAKLDTWQKTQVARHPDRPHCVDYLEGLIDEFVELHGDRRFGDDQAIVGGLGICLAPGVADLG